MDSVCEELHHRVETIVKQPMDPDAQRQLEETKHREAERREQLRREAQAVYRTMEGWHRVEDPAAWVTTYQEAEHDYLSGRFLMERLGAERHLDPEMMA